MGAIRAYAARNKWTAEDILLLTNIYESCTRDELKSSFPERSTRSVESKANFLGLAKIKRPPRTADQIREAKRRHMAQKRSSDPEAARQRGREFYSANRERITVKVRRYYAKRFFWGRAGKLKGADRASGADISRLWKAQRGKCALTGRSLDRTAQLDHIHPKAKGGTDLITNLRWVCAEANLAKRDMTDRELIELCEDILATARHSCWIGRRIQHAIA